MTSELDLYRSIIDKIEQGQEALWSINGRLTAIETDLKYHIHRSNLLEAQVEALKKDHNRLQGFFIIGGWVLGTFAVIATILEHFGAFK